MCTQFSLLKYIKPPPNKNERKKYNTYEYNATQSHRKSQCGIRSCPPIPKTTTFCLSFYLHHSSMLYSLNFKKFPEN